ARLRELHPGGRDPTDASGNLERCGVSVVSQSAVVRPTTARLRQLWPALELVVVHAEPTSVDVVVVIPTFNEEESIEPVIRAIPRDVVCRIIVADGGSSDRTELR